MDASGIGFALTGERSPPLAPPQGGEVLAAGRARGQAAQGFSCPKPLSVVASLAASRVCFAGRCPPLTRPDSPYLEPSSPTQNSKEAKKVNLAAGVDCRDRKLVTQLVEVRQRRHSAKLTSESGEIPSGSEWR